MEPAGRLVLTTPTPSSAASAAILASLRRNVIDSKPTVMSKCFSTSLLLPLTPIARPVNFAHLFEFKGGSMRHNLKPQPLDGGRTGDGPE